MKTGERIKELRTKKGMTQEELASQTELTSRTIQRIEKGEVDPRAYTLQMIAKALEVDISIFRETESEENTYLENDRAWLALLHLTGMFPLFFPTIIMKNRKGYTNPEINKHYRAVLGLQSFVLFAAIGGLWPYYWSGVIIPTMGSLLVGCLFSIVNTMNVLNGEDFIHVSLSKKKKLS